MFAGFTVLNQKIKRVIRKAEPEKLGKVSLLFLIVSFLLLQTNNVFAQWTRKADGLKKRGECASVLYKGRIYVFGGFGEHPNLEKTSEVYDPALNKWSYIASYPVNKAVSHQAVALIDDKVWHIGGRTIDSRGPVTSQVIIYDITNNSWKNGPDLKDPATGKLLPLGSGGAALLGRTLHVFGGFGPAICTDQNKYHLTLDIDKYQVDPINTKWENKLAPMPIPRHHFNTVSLEGKIYAIGGQFTHDCGAPEQKYVHVYDPIANKWTRLTDLPSANSHAEGATFPVDGKIYMVGGQDNTNKRATNKVMILTPSGNSGKGSWANATQYQLPTYSIGLVAKVIGTKFIVSHGAIGNISNERKETYSAAIARNTPYKFGFVAKCVSRSVSINQKIIVKNLLYTIEGSKNYQLTSSASWLKVTKNATGLALPSGMAIEATINTTGLAKGNYSAIIKVNGTGSGTTFTSTSFCVNITVGSSTTYQQKATVTAINNSDSQEKIKPRDNQVALNKTNLPASNFHGQTKTRPDTITIVEFTLTDPATGNQKTTLSPTAVSGKKINTTTATWLPLPGSSSFTSPFKTAALPEKSQGLRLIVYPNPVSGGNVQVRLAGYASQETVGITLSDALGKLLQVKTVITNNNGQGSTELWMSNFNRGVYFIKTQGNSGTKQVKVVKE